MAKRKSPSLLRIAASRVGPLKGSRVLAYMIAWDMVRQELGHEPTPEEYGEWWKQSRATSFREQAAFRECFPGEKNPARLMDLARSSWDERRGVAGLGAVQLRELVG